MRGMVVYAAPETARPGSASADVPIRASPRRMRESALLHHTKRRNWCHTCSARWPPLGSPRRPRSGKWRKGNNKASGLQPQRIGCVNAPTRCQENLAPYSAPTNCRRRVSRIVAEGIVLERNPRPIEASSQGGVGDSRQMPHTGVVSALWAACCASDKRVSAGSGGDERSDLSSSAATSGRQPLRTSASMASASLTCMGGPAAKSDWHPPEASEAARRDARTRGRVDNSAGGSRRGLASHHPEVRQSQLLPLAHVDSVSMSRDAALCLSAPFARIPSFCHGPSASATAKTKALCAAGVQSTKSARRAMRA
eukprot:scaffold18271_cov29-Tisochrysis_lutea.AAC.4